MTEESRFEQEKARAEKHEKQYEEILNALKVNEQIKDYLAQYDEKQVESFLRDYAKLKVDVLEWGPRMQEWQEKADMQWQKKAFECLKEIQQKKLFDLQCRWRAGLVTIDKVQISAELWRWESQILDCPFIEPVTVEDIEMYKRYMNSFNYEHAERWGVSWQDHYGLKMAYHGADDAYINFPEWYDFHNGSTGYSFLIDLPDVRGEKEEYYMNLWRRDRDEKMEKELNEDDEEMEEELDENDEGGATPASLHQLYSWNDKDIMKEFALEFEDADTIKKMKQYDRYMNSYDSRHDDAMEIIADLSEFKEIFPMESCYDWFEGLQKCLVQYNKQNTIEALPAAYEHYRMYVDMGIRFSEKEDIKDDSILKLHFMGILRGRVLAGEPEDFDF